MLLVSDDSVKHLIYRRKPQVSIVGDYKINTKAAHNHFFRTSDMKVKGCSFVSLCVSDFIKELRFLL